MKPPHSPAPGRRALRPALLTGLALAVVLGACRQKEASAPTEVAGTARRAQATRVRTEPLVRREMIRTLQTTTVVESENEVQIFPRLGGLVVEIRVEEGDAVKQDEVLAVLDQRDATAALNDSRIALQEARDNVEKSELFKQESEARMGSSKLTWEQKVRDHERNENAGLISDRDLDASRLERDTAYGEFLANKLAHDRSLFEQRAARTALQRAELALERENLNYSYTYILAPFEGVIAQRMIRVGDTANAANPAFVLTDAEHLRAVFYRPQRELPLFTGGLKPANGHAAGGIEIKARAEALPDRVFEGRIERVSPSIDPTNGSFRVTARLEQPESDSPEQDPSGIAGRLLPGMLVRLEIVTDRHPDALVVPKRALTREGDERLIFVVEGNRARRVRVQEGFSDEDHVEVIEIVPSGDADPSSEPRLAVGDRIVVVGSRAELGEDDEVLDESLEEKVEEEEVEEPAAEEAQDSENTAGADSATDAIEDGQDG